MRGSFGNVNYRKQLLGSCHSVQTVLARAQQHISLRRRLWRGQVHAILATPQAAVAVPTYAAAAAASATAAAAAVAADAAAATTAAL